MKFEKIEISNNKIYGTSLSLLGIWFIIKNNNLFVLVFGIILFIFGQIIK